MKHMKLLAFICFGLLGVLMYETLKQKSPAKDHKQRMKVLDQLVEEAEDMKLYEIQ